MLLRPQRMRKGRMTKLWILKIIVALGVLRRAGFQDIFNFARIKIFSCLLFLSPTACYEGWEDPTVASPSDQNPSAPTPSPPSPKLYSYILFTSIRLDPSALSNPTCFPSADIKDFKNAEFSQRIAEISASLAGITEKLVTKIVSITTSDCSKLGGILNEALKVTPWLPDTAPQSDPQNRLTLHLKAAFWQGDPALSPPSQVSREDWQAFTDVKSKGIRSKSITYHVISGGGSGYFNTWSQALPQTMFKKGDPINQIDPSPGGITARSEHIKKDTLALIQWITESFQ